MLARQSLWVALGFLASGAACTGNDAPPAVGPSSQSDEGAPAADAGSSDALRSPEALGSPDPSGGRGGGAFDARVARCRYPDPRQEEGGAGRERVRIMAANITSGNGSSYEEPGIRLFQGLKPDIVLLQEARYADGLRALVDIAFGPEFQVAVEEQPGGIPNAVVSKYPIVQAGEWDDPNVPDRDFAYARIDVPGPVDLWAVSVHFKTSDATTRAEEARTLVAAVRAAVPSTDYLVIGGDLNTGSDREKTLTELGAATVVAPPYPVDGDGEPRTSGARSRHYDWVLPGPLLDRRKMPLVLGSNVFCDGLVFDTRVYTPLAEVPPIRLGDSDAPNMQHMPVVRDFLLGGD